MCYHPGVENCQRCQFLDRSDANENWVRQPKSNLEFKIHANQDAHSKFKRIIMDNLSVAKLFIYACGRRRYYSGKWGIAFSISLIRSDWVKRNEISCNVVEKMPKNFCIWLQILSGVQPQTSKGLSFAIFCLESTYLLRYTVAR